MMRALARRRKKPFSLLLASLTVIVTAASAVAVAVSTVSLGGSAPESPQSSKGDRRVRGTGQQAEALRIAQAPPCDHSTFPVLPTSPSPLVCSPCSPWLALRSFQCLCQQFLTLYSCLLDISKVPPVSQLDFDSFGICKRSGLRNRLSRIRIRTFQSSCHLKGMSSLPVNNKLHLFRDKKGMKLG